MACSINYNGKKFTMSEFSEYVKNNLGEFRDKLSQETINKIVSGNHISDAVIDPSMESLSELSKVAQNISKNLPREEISRIEGEYKVKNGTPGFDTAVQKEMLTDLFNNKHTPIRQEALKVLEGTYGNLSSSQAANLKGIERSFYNVVNDKNSEYRLYPEDFQNVPVVLKKGTNEWEVFDYNTLHDDLISGKINADTHDGYESLVVQDYIINLLSNNTKEDTENVDYSKIMSDTEKSKLVSNLLNLLSKLGIKTMTLSNYIETYNKKNGVDPSVEALADIANKVIAIAEGKMSIENLTEEVAHFLTETYNNQDEIRGVLREVENTDEWKENAAHYFELYDDGTLTQEEVREKVQREIFGKLLTNRIIEINQSKEGQSLFSKVKSIANKYFSRIKNYLNPSVNSNLNSILDRIAESVTEQKKIDSMYETESNNEPLFKTFFSAKKNPKNLDLLNLQRLRQDTERLIRNSDTLSYNRLKELQNNIRNLDDEMSIVSYLDVVKSTAIEVGQSLSASENELGKIRTAKGRKSGSNLEKFTFFSRDKQIGILTHEVLDSLSSVREYLVSSYKGSDGQALINKLDSLREEINNFQGRYTRLVTESQDIMLEKMQIMYGISDEGMEAFRNAVKGVITDSNLFEHNLFSLSSMKNPVLGMFGRVISGIYHRTNMATKNFTNEFISKMKELGIPQERYQEFYDRLIERDENGNITGFLRSVYDYRRRNDDIDRNEVEEYNRALRITREKGEIAVPDGELTNMSQMGYEFPHINELDSEAAEDFFKRTTEFKERVSEHPIEGETYRAARERMFEELEAKGVEMADGTISHKIPARVRQMLAQWANSRRTIKAPYIVDGKIDYSSMDENDKLALDSIAREKSYAKSLYTIDGKLKTGTDYEVAVWLKAIDNAYFEKNSSNRVISKEFIEALEQHIKNGGDARDWFKSNAYIRFSAKFWDSIRDAISNSRDKFRRALDRSVNLSPLQIEKAENLLNQLEELSKRKSEMMRQFRDPNNPIQTDTSIMGSSKEEIISIEESVESIYSDLNNLLQDELDSEVRNPFSLTESPLNDSYYSELRAFESENKSKGEIDFLRRNMTSGNITKIAKIKTTLESFARTGKMPKSNLLKLELERLYGIPSTLKGEAYAREVANLLKSTPIDDIVLESARRRVASYYKMFAPKGYSDFMAILEDTLATNPEEGISVISDMLEGKQGISINGIQFDVANLLEVSPKVEWTEDENPRDINPNYIKTTKNGSTRYFGELQPSQEYLNHKFIEEYNIDMTTFYKTGEMMTLGTTEAKAKELEMINFLVQARHAAFKSQGVVGTRIANAYALPGVRKSEYSNLKTFAKNPIQGIKQAYRDTMKNTVDKKLYGESDNGYISTDPRDVNNMRIPLINVSPLENLEDTSTDLMHSYATHVYNAELYKNRKNAVAQVATLENMLLRQTIKGKRAIDSYDYKTFLEFKKAFMYGVKESKKFEVNILGKSFDLTNALRTIDKTLGTINVGLNPAVSFTAGASAATFTLTEGMVGEFLDKDSLSEGFRLFHSKVGSHLSETGQVEKTNEITIYEQVFGLSNVLQQVENSGVNRALREMFKDGMGSIYHSMTEIATKPIAPAIMFGAMTNLRYVKLPGKSKFELMNKTQFRNTIQKSAVSMSKDEIETLWKSFEGNSVMNNISVEKGAVKYSDKFKEIFSEINRHETNADSDLHGAAQHALESLVQEFTLQVVSKVDAKLPLHDQSVATRNALLRFLLRHRGWWTIWTQNRFKSRHFNYATNKYEEGSYTTLFRVASQMVKALADKDGGVRTIIEKLTPEEKMNLKRVLIDTVISAILVAIGHFLVVPWSDDDDNKENNNVQFLAFMYYRLVSEQMTSGLAGIPSSKEILETPLVGASVLAEALKLSNYSTDEVSSGAYKGHSKLFKLLAKNTFARHYFDTRYGIKDKSDYYRLKNEWTLPFLGKLSAKELEEEEKERRQQMEEDFTSTIKGGL